MNNQTDSAISLYIETAYQQVAEERAFIASCALLVYGSVLHLGDEVQYIWQWKEKLSPPNILYVLAKYPLLAYQSLLVVQSFVDITSMEFVLFIYVFNLKLRVFGFSVCNDLGYVGGALSILAYIGVQGCGSSKIA
ncbi:hypothetical protein Clacol_000307 [Clathrus columnatus]|uniref:DUF6533 domain-containing protein n=1 Tax=Clathrus columnatus TaxID=1419009 RepID=A0AAV5A0E5_9AGAM|nr:hypothetical protein Clacol_000307 [Clathrus columnatus]